MEIRSILTKFRSISMATVEPRPALVSLLGRMLVLGIGVLGTQLFSFLERIRVNKKSAVIDISTWSSLHRPDPER
jgi:hypothetical protein